MISKRTLNSGSVCARVKIVLHRPFKRSDLRSSPNDIRGLQVQDIEREYVPLPGGDARGQDIGAGHRHGGRVLDTVRGTQAVRVASTVRRWRRHAIVGAAGRVALVVRARRRHARAVRAPQPPRAPRTVPDLLPAQTVQQLLRQRAERDRRLVRGRRARQTVTVAVGRRWPATARAVRPVVRPARRHSVR